MYYESYEVLKLYVAFEPLSAHKWSTLISVYTKVKPESEPDSSLIMV